MREDVVVESEIVRQKQQNGNITHVDGDGSNYREVKYVRKYMPQRTRRANARIIIYY